MKRFGTMIVTTFAATILLMAGCTSRGDSKSFSNGNSAKPAPELPTQGVTWINSKPQTLKKLRGKVVLIDFWEYTCINCIRSFPFEKHLYRQYHDDGMEILGIHDPEFNIAYKTPNVRQAVKRFELPWPVAADPQFAIWHAYDSHTWPNYFLIGPQGDLIGHWSGEGHDAEIEQAIQKQLAKIDPHFKPADHPVEHTNWFTPDCGDMTGETYVGRWHGRGALQGQGGYQKGLRDFHAAQTPDDGKFVLNGKWETAKNGSTYRGATQTPAPEPPGPGDATGPDVGSLTLTYHAREIYAVMNTSHARSNGNAKGSGGSQSDNHAASASRTGHSQHKAIKVYVTQDGHYLTKKNAAADTQFDSQGRSFIMVREPRMYYVVLNHRGNDGRHVLTLRPAAPGLTVNSFTFGNNCSIDFAHLYSHQQIAHPDSDLNPVSDRVRQSQASR